MGDSDGDSLPQEFVIAGGGTRCLPEVSTMPVPDDERKASLLVRTNLATDLVDWAKMVKYKNEDAESIDAMALSPDGTKLAVVFRKRSSWTD